MDRVSLECLQKAVAVMAASVSQESVSKTLAVDVAQEYANEPDGFTALLNGLMQLATFLLEDVEKHTGQSPMEQLRVFGESVSLKLTQEDGPS